MSLCRCASTMRWPGWRLPKNKKQAVILKMRITAISFLSGCTVFIPTNPVPRGGAQISVWSKNRWPWPCIRPGAGDRPPHTKFFSFPTCPKCAYPIKRHRQKNRELPRHSRPLACHTQKFMSDSQICEYLVCREWFFYNNGSSNERAKIGSGGNSHAE